MLEHYRDCPKWITTGKIVLIAKDPSKKNNLENIVLSPAFLIENLDGENSRLAIQSVGNRRAVGDLQKSLKTIY